MTTPAPAPPAPIDDGTGDSRTSGPVAALRGARAALVFLTRLPLEGSSFSPAEWRWASAWFPAVGAMVGALSAIVWALTRPAGPLVAGSVAVAAALLVTGALHEDGLADTADALGGSRDKERLFVILKDSRIGVFGAAALVMALLLRVALLARLDPLAPLALVLVGAWTRTAPVWLMAALAYVTAPGASRSGPIVRVGWPQALAATGASAALGVGAVGLGWLPASSALVLAGVLALTTILCARCFRARAGGITGDFLGATQQLGEVALLLTLALSLPPSPG